MIAPFIGEVVLYAFNFAPIGWATCAGQILPIRQNLPLFLIIGNAFGGDGHVVFALPDFQSVSPNGLRYCIALTGDQPNQSDRPSSVGEISVLPYAGPESWYGCNGELREIASDEGLFEVLGTRFGGDGTSTFGIPNLAETPPRFPPADSESSMYWICSESKVDPSEPFLGEVRLSPYTSAPEGWMSCTGQTLPINQHQALFSLLGLTFGGDGIRTFGLPNLGNVQLPSGLQYYIAVQENFAYPHRS
jgi:microcystin-dependent protein